MFFVLKQKSNYKIPSTNIDGENQFDSVADVANRSGACGVRFQA